MQRGRPRKGERRNRLVAEEQRILLRGYRVAGLKPADIARESGIRRDAVSRYLNNKSSVPDPALLVPPRLLACLAAGAARSTAARSRGKKSELFDHERVAATILDLVQRRPARVRAIYITIHRLVLCVPVAPGREHEVHAAFMAWPGKKSRRSRYSKYRHQLDLPCHSGAGSFHVLMGPLGSGNQPYLVVEIHGTAMESGAVFEVLRVLEPYCQTRTILECVSGLDLTIDYVFDELTAPMLVCHDRDARQIQTWFEHHHDRGSVNVRFGSRKSRRTNLHYNKGVKLAQDDDEGPWHLQAHRATGRDIVRRELTIRFKRAERSLDGMMRRITQEVESAMLWDLRCMEPIAKVVGAEMLGRGSLPVLDALQPTMKCRWGNDTSEAARDYRRHVKQRFAHLLRDASAYVEAAADKAVAASRPHFPQPAEVVALAAPALRRLLESFATPTRSWWCPVVALSPSGPVGQIPRYVVRQPPRAVPSPVSLPLPVHHPLGRQVVWYDDAGGPRISDANEFYGKARPLQLHHQLRCGCPLDATECVEAAAHRAHRDLQHEAGAVASEATAPDTSFNFGWNVVARDPPIRRTRSTRSEAGVTGIG